MISMVGRVSRSGIVLYFGRRNFVHREYDKELRMDKVNREQISRGMAHNNAINLMWLRECVNGDLARETTRNCQRFFE